MSKKDKREKSIGSKPTLGVLGECIDKLFKLQKEVDEANKAARDAAAARSKLEAKMLDKFGTQKIKGAMGEAAQAIVKVSKYPTIKNRKKLEKYIVKHKAFELFQARINSRAYFERLDEGEEVPGVNIFERTWIQVKERKG